MSQSPEKRRCTLGNEPQNTGVKQRGFSFEAPKVPGPTTNGTNGPTGTTRPGRQQNATGLTVPKGPDRARSWDGSTKGAEPPKSPKSPITRNPAVQAKSASPVVPNREVKRVAAKEGRAGEPKAAPSPVKARTPGKAAGRGMNSEKLLQAAINMRNSKSLRLALARATQAPPALMAQASALLERLAAAESAALQSLQSAEREEREPPVPWRLICLDFDRTIAKEHMWGTHKDAPLEQIPVSEETFTDLALFRWLVRAVRKRAGEVAIATFGRADVAGKAMQFALGEEHGIFITTPKDFPDPAPEADAEAARCPEGSSWLGDKNTQLASLARQFGVAPTDMILLDDDLHNVQEAVKAGVSAFHAPAGLNKAAVQKVAELIGLTGQSEADNAESKASV